MLCVSLTVSAATISPKEAMVKRVLWLDGALSCKPASEQLPLSAEGGGFPRGGVLLAQSGFPPSLIGSCLDWQRQT